MEVISNKSVNVNMAAKFPQKYGASRRNVAFATFQLLPRTKMGNYDRNSRSRYYIRKKLRTRLLLIGQY